MADPEFIIAVDDLTRRFPRCEALGGVSFRIRRGEIAGVLGPNGSGKTTTLRILAGYLAPTSGSVRVAGYDVATHSLEVRRRIGYLPESVPLYPEMRVAEYLAFRGRIKGLRRARLAARLQAVVEQCGLGGCTKQLIGTLSRGFRQRTGLADCLLPEPEVLLLDEPLAGLDPAQVEAVRKVLRNGGSRCTVLFSTHVLAEAERLCHQALILNAGLLAAADSPARLVEATRRIRAELRAPSDALAEALPTVAGAQDFRLESLSEGWVAVCIQTEKEDLRLRLAQLAEERRWPLRELRSDSQSFAEAFRRLTARTPLASASQTGARP